MHRVSGDVCLPFRVSCASTWNHVVKANQCVQNVAVIGTAANNATDITRNIRAVFQCIRNAEFKFTIEKCHFGVRQFEFLG